MTANSLSLRSISNKLSASIAGLLLGFGLFSCTPVQQVSRQLPEEPIPANPISIEQIDPTSSWVVDILAGMSLEEKAAQVVFARAEGSYLSWDDERWQVMERLAKEGKIGGFVFFAGDVYEYAVHANKLQALAKTPLLIGADFEFGAAMRVRRATLFPRAMLVGATRNPDYAYRMGRAVGREARALGVHQVYAPVVDINNNPLNPVINTRAFGENPQLVSEMGIGFVRGLQEEGVIATAKHFPGHGDTGIDSHLDLPVLNFSRERLDSIELVVFKKAIQNGVLSIMVAHLAIPSLEPSRGVPATLSHNITTKILREELGFEGLAVTDAMEMRGLSRGFSNAEAAVRAIQAGADAVLLPLDVEGAIAAIVEAVRRGTISESRLDSSVCRILGLKESLGLDKDRFVSLDNVFKVVGTGDHRRLAQIIARDGVTLLQNNRSLLPLPRNQRRRILSISLSDAEDPSAGNLFRSLAARRTYGIQHVRIDPRTTAAEFDAILQRAGASDIILLHLYVKTRSGENTGTLQSQHAQFIATLLKLKKKTAVISFGNPYIVGDMQSADAVLLGYSEAEVVIEAAVEILFGEADARGKLPISIPPAFAYGTGVELKKSTLRESDQFIVGSSQDRFSDVDDVVEQAIRDSAFPGAVLAVVKDGVLIHHKAYGRYEYDPFADAITTETMFDLASLTKVVATTSAVMRLVDEQLITLEDPVAKHLPAFGQNGKENTTIYNLMVHNSGLPAWKRFYEFCKTPQEVVDSVFASPLVYPTGDSTAYSDLGFITLGKLVEKVAGVPIDRYADSLFFKPLNMTNTMFNPPARFLGRIAPTEVDSFWQKTYMPVRGRVHDENAAVLGGISGHAGLFSTAGDLAIMMQMLMNDGVYGADRYLAAETIRRFTKRQSSASTRAIGWDTRSPLRSWSGSLLSNRTFLHTGFTGTSIAADPERNLVIIFLTNRVYPTRTSTKISEVRPRVHDAVVRALSN